MPGPRMLYEGSHQRDLTELLQSTADAEVLGCQQHDAVRLLAQNALHPSNQCWSDCLRGQRHGQPQVHRAVPLEARLKECSKVLATVKVRNHSEDRWLGGHCGNLTAFVAKGCFAQGVSFLHRKC